MIRIEIDDREVRQALEDLRRRASSMAPAMHAIGQTLMEGSRDLILLDCGWTGQPFTPNSPATLARKKGNKPLIDQKTFVTSRLFYEADAVSPGLTAGRGLKHIRDATAQVFERLAYFAVIDFDGHHGLSSFCDGEPWKFGVHGRRAQRGSMRGRPALRRHHATPPATTSISPLPIRLRMSAGSKR